MKIRLLKLSVCLAVVVTFPRPIRGHVQTFTAVHLVSIPPAVGGIA